MKLRPSTQTHIDLTRSLPSLRDSLTPTAEHDTGRAAGRMFIAFVLLMAATLAAYYLSTPKTPAHEPATNTTPAR